MENLKAEQVYNAIKKGGVKFNEKEHSIGILSAMIETGRKSEFMKKFCISASTFNNWCMRNAIFRECYLVGKEIAKCNWEREGEENRDNPNFNYNHWEKMGKVLFGNGNQNKIEIRMDYASSPYEQYKDIIKQATMGEFDSVELKQIMECINIGVRAWEANKVQDEINEMREDIKRMNANNVCANAA